MPSFPSIRLPHRLAALLLTLLFAAAAPAATSAAPDHAIAQREHTAWTARNGAPDDIGAIAQTSDGWLWLGTARGLYRFDGKRFAPVRPAPSQRFPDTDVYVLQADPAGGLWIGWRMGGISHLRDGVVRNWGVEDGLPRGSIWGFAVDGAGVWAAGLDGLAWYDGHRWKRVGPEQGFKARKASSVFVGTDGTVAVLSEQGLYVRAPGEKRFSGPVGKLDARQPFLQGRNADGSPGPIYLLEKRGIRIVDSVQDYERLSHPWIHRQRDPVTGSMLADRAGGLWYDDEGLRRVANPLGSAVPPGRHHADGAESFGVAQGLSGATIQCLFEDREGTVWVGTDMGLDRFRATRLVHVRGEIRNWATLLPAPGAGVLASDGSQTWRVENAHATLALPAKSGDAMTAGEDVLLVGGIAGIERRSRDGARLLGTIALPPQFSPVGKIHALALQGDGSVWMAAIGGGAWRYGGGSWERAAMLPQEGKKTPLSMLADRRGRMWFGYIDNEVALLDGDQVRTFGKDQGLAVGKVALLTQADGDVLAGGADGLARFDGKRFVALRAEPAAALTGLTGAAVTADSLWLNGAAGVVRLDRRALAGPGVLAARVFDERDGLRGRTSILHVGTMTLAADGRLWLSTSAGISWLGATATAPQALPYQPSLLALEADGKAYAPGRPLDLPPRPARISFGYASPALSAAERLRYRYRLEGYDQGWQDGGAATEASYTGLAPGAYRFVVQAMNGDGVPGPASAPMLVRVAPSLTQTTWFKAGCALLAAAVLWALYSYRLHVQARRLLAIERTRQAERERIARELHDTLLQGVQGLIFVVDAAVQSTAQSAEQERLRGRLDAALVRARALVAEARDRVHGLRAGERAMLDVAPMLAALAARIGTEYDRDIRFEVKGDAHPVAGHLADTCCRIAEEALLNACRHAAARDIGLELTYTPDMLVLAIGDDGAGIDGEVAKTGRPGHWGLAGMHERAVLAGGSLELLSAPGQGTRLLLRLPLGGHGPA